MLGVKLSAAIFVNLIVGFVSQSCREYSQTCADSAACCGGCCLQGICRDTYADCRLGGDPCTNFYCPPGDECYVYQAKDCGGCGPTKECRTVSIPLAPEKYTTQQIYRLVENMARKVLPNAKTVVFIEVLYIFISYCL
nr:uncharacterized protein LOC111509921 [Leptinotarsa decemlineata]